MTKKPTEKQMLTFLYEQEQGRIKQERIAEIEAEYSHRERVLAKEIRHKRACLEDLERAYHNVNRERSLALDAV